MKRSQIHPRLKSEVGPVGQDPICIFGGAFDPIHIGHLIIAEDVRIKKCLERVIFIPCNIPPTKANTVAGPADRLEMVRLAVRHNPGFEACDLEIRRDGPSYTVDTLREARRQYGTGRLYYLLMGMDQLNAIESWHEPSEIAEICKILAVPRPGFTQVSIPSSFERNVEILDTRQIELSSTEIRERLRKGISIRYMVPTSVIEYITLHGLYGVGEGEKHVT